MSTCCSVCDIFKASKLVAVNRACRYHAARNNSGVGVLEPEPLHKRLAAAGVKAGIAVLCFVGF